MVEQMGKYGRYAKCTTEGCKGTVDKSANTADNCPRCSSPLKDKGAFLGCSAYPKCSFSVDTKAWANAKKDDLKCAKCGRLMVERRGANGPFLSCVGYPECKQTQPSPRAKKGPFPKKETRK
jgi:ssDNA-binding Zn-finger/Zn-ribbon topoisomerase 1